MSEQQQSEPAISFAANSSGEQGRANPAASARPYGPGLLESLGWFLSAWVTHAIGLLGTALLLMYILASAGMPWQGLEMLEFIEANQFTLLAGEQFVFVTLILIAAWIRLGGRLGQRLGSRPLPLAHFFFLTCLILPLSTLGNLFHHWGMQGWKTLLTHYPQLQQFDTMQAMDLLQQVQATSPVWALLLIFAVAPAFGEELLFRGVIGRGLVSRWGMVWGILFTSLLFALAHVHPVHILAVFPIGVVLHFVYYTTKSFWAPLYVHFGNNALAVLGATSAIEAHPGDPLSEPLTLSALVTVSLSLLIFLAFLWQSRIDFVKQDGTLWKSPRFQLELPVEIPLRRTYSALSWKVCLGGLVPLIGFLIAYSTHL